MRRLLAVLPLLCGAFLVPPAHAADEVTVTKTTVRIDTTVGPDDQTHCEVVADLYVPSTATAATPAPAILTTNGFGGSKDDQAGTGQAFGKRGYVVLSYSGLGFGGSGCDIHLDDREWDGKAASDLVTYLAGLGYVRLDGPGDPRVGMIGGSYGGQVQFAVAAIDKRVDTIVPIITWHDLAYSLAPNNVALGAQPDGLTPGVPKWQWTELFFSVGMSQPVQHPDSTPKPPSTCPGFAPEVCTANARTITKGYPDEETRTLLRHASVATYLDDIEVPTLLAQGQADTLFNLNEAVATYQGLKARGVPVKLMFQSWGHSGSAPAPGELDLGDPEGTYQGQVFAAWFDKWLKGLDADTGPEFEYFRPWVDYEGSAEPAYGKAPRYPLKDTLPLRLSDVDALAGPGSPVVLGSATMVAPPGGQPASYSETSALQTQEPFASREPSDPPGQYAAFSTPPLVDEIDVVGIPTVELRLRTSTPIAPDPSLQPTLYLKLYDVAPYGEVTMVHRLVAPVRLSSTDQPVKVNLPGIVHRFPKGHRVRLVVATTDQAYLSSRAGHVITVENDPADPNVLMLPVTSPAAALAIPRLPRPAPKVLAARPAARPAGLPATGGAEWLPLLAAAAAGTGLVARRRRA
jgi:ABC-2 type transport system ATP-binding protein